MSFLTFGHCTNLRCISEMGSGGKFTALRSFSTDLTLLLVENATCVC